MNPAHFFTVLRICISPLFPVIYLGYERLNIPITSVPYLLLALLIVSEFSDIFDGFLARKRNQVTDLGKVLDPMADSITHISLFLAFTQGFVHLPLLIVLVFLYRDFFISTLRTLCALRGVALAARFSGKVKAIMQAVVAFVIVLLMIPYVEGYLSQELFQLISLIAMSIAAVYTALSAIDYCYSNRVYIKKAVHR
jgi:CDP-diacylglycerol--glycerol-3-phosphate 3-phosphatidyltransferase